MERGLVGDLDGQSGGRRVRRVRQQCVRREAALPRHRVRDLAGPVDRPPRVDLMTGADRDQRRTTECSGDVPRDSEFLAQRLGVPGGVVDVVAVRRRRILPERVRRRGRPTRRVELARPPSDVARGPAGSTRSIGPIAWSRARTPETVRPLSDQRSCSTRANVRRQRSRCPEPVRIGTQRIHSPLQGATDPLFGAVRKALERGGLIVITE